MSHATGNKQPAVSRHSWCVSAGCQPAGAVLGCQPAEAPAHSPCCLPLCVPLQAVSQLNLQPLLPLLSGMHLQAASQLKLQLAVLLHGPDGSGKMTAISAAAAALGVNVVPFNCHEMRAESGAKTATALRAVCESAQQFSPALLVLQHLQVLAKPPAGSGGGEI